MNVPGEGYMATLPWLRPEIFEVAVEINAGNHPITLDSVHRYQLLTPTQRHLPSKQVQRCTQSRCHAEARVQQKASSWCLGDRRDAVFPVVQ